MSVSASVLFDRPQQEIASLLNAQITRCIRAQLVTGFATVEGVKVLESGFLANPGKLDTLVVGAATYRAFQALDRLLGIGVPQRNLHVHLGHTRLTGSKAKHRFYRYHPMLHGKVYYFEHPDGLASAVVGSHNITGFALTGLNGEAAVLLEGPVSSPEFQKIRDHIREAQAQAMAYSPDMKEAYAWWTYQFMEGMGDKANDTPREAENTKTVVILAENSNSEVPDPDAMVYFELPLALGAVTSMRAEIHLYVFDKLPPTPWAGLQSLRQAVGSCWCRPQGLEMQRGGVELRADWFIDNNRNPVLQRTPNPFRPQPTGDMQQIRAQSFKRVFAEYEYLFSSGSRKWLPVFGNSFTNRPETDYLTLQASQEYAGLFSELELRPNAEHLPWDLVSGLEPEEKSTESNYEKALIDYSPDSGSYVMVSLRRREVGSVRTK